MNAVKKNRAHQNATAIDHWQVRIGLSIVASITLFLIYYITVLLPFTSFIRWTTIAFATTMIVAAILSKCLTHVEYNTARVVFDPIFNTIRVLRAGFNLVFPWEDVVPDGYINLARDKPIFNVEGEKYRTKDGQWVYPEWLLHLTAHKYFLLNYVNTTLDGAEPVFRGRVTRFLTEYIAERDFDELMPSASKPGNFTEFENAFKAEFNGDDVENRAHTDVDEARLGIWTGTPQLNRVTVSADAEQADEAESEAAKTKDVIKQYTEEGVTPDLAMMAAMMQQGKGEAIIPLIAGMNQFIRPNRKNNPNRRNKKNRNQNQED